MRKYLSLSVSALVESVTIRANCAPLHRTQYLPYFTLCRTMGSVICKNVTTADTGKSQKGKMENNEEYVEDIVCKVDDIKENEMKTFDLTDAGKILLIRQNGQLSAIGNKCTHYNAPLEKGALGNGYVRCPFHGACFNIMTGDIEDFPGIDSLPCYQVTVQDNNIKVRAKRSELKQGKRVKLMTKRDIQNENKMVIIGGGPSGGVCVETLRQEGFTGKITLINKENCLPYDRVKVSKTLDLEINKIQFRNIDFYNDNGIEVISNTEATKVDTENKKITLSNGNTIDYDCLYIATGSKPRELQIPGSDVPQVCTLRSYEDAKYINDMLSEDKHVVCVGSSFISMEAAAACVNKVKSVTVIGRGTVPFLPVFGKKVGKRIIQLFEQKGIKFFMNTEVVKCNNEDGKLRSVELANGEVISADIVIAGLGSTLYTQFLANSGLDLNKDGSITVNDYLETNVSGVFAGGDIANAPVYCSDNNLATIGHFPLAHKHGQIAALNMLGKKKPLKAIPVFWTMLFGKSLRYTGHGNHDDIKIVGDLNELKYYAYHLKGDRVIAVSSCQNDPIVAQFANFLEQGRKLYRQDIENNSLSWQTIDNNLATIGHFPLAHKHGQIAALNMLGKKKPLKAIPVFWTMLFGKSLRYTGHGNHDDIKIVGDLNELKYYAYHLKGDRVIAVSSCQNDPIVAQFANFLEQGRKLYRQDIENNSLSWQTM